MWAFGLCVAALAATACSGWDLKSEYHYKSEAKMLQELDKKIHQHAGFLTSSNFILQIKENEVLVKIQNPKLHAVNERPDPDHDHEHHYQSPPPEIEQELIKPFRINYQHDVLTSIQVAKDDPPWSVNAKKALAARFQLENINSKNASQRNFYTRSEDGPSGECEVDYAIDLHSKNEIYVTKNKNFKKCKSESYRYYDNQNLWNCLEGENALYAPFQKSETTYIDLTGDRENYYVHWQRMEESFTYAPYGLDADYIKGSTKLEITLTGIVPLTEEIHIPDDAVTHHGLHSEFPHAADVESVEDLKNHPYGFYYFLGRKDTVEKVAETFERLMTVDDGKKYTEVFNTKPMPLIFIQLTFAMTTLNYDELKDLHENHVNKEGHPGEEMRIRKLVFGDALVATGTSSAFMYLKDCMTNGKMPHGVINHLLKQIPMSIEPISEQLLEEFYELCKDPHIHDNVQNRKVCYLAFSTVVHEQCVSRYHKVQQRHPPAGKIHCTPEIAEKFFEKLLAEPEAHAQDSFSRTLFIKVAGNFGTPGSLKELLKIIHDDHIHQYFKFNAIMSLEHHASLYPEEVLHAMLPIYYSGSEPHEIRMAAFLYILFSQPKLHHLEAIVENLKFEHDHQVAHYVMSSIEQLSHLESPCYSELMLMCKRVSRFLDRLDFKTNFDFRHSFGWYNDGFNRKFQIGGQTNMNYITSNHSYVPQHVYLYLMDYVGHTFKSPLEIGYNGYGLDKVIDNFFGIPRQKDEAPTVEKELKEFDEKLHIEVREPEPMLADFYLNSFGSTVDFFHLNDTTFEHLAERDAGQLPALMASMKDIGERSLKRFYTGRQKKLMMPSALGLAYCVNSVEINFAHYRNNQFKLDVDPKLLTGATDDEAPPTINVKIDAHVVHDRMLITDMGTALLVNQVFVSAGVMEREYRSLPLKLKIALDPKTPKLVVKYTPVLPHTRLHASFTPFTVLNNMSNPNFDDLKDAGVLPYHHKKHELVQVDENYFHDYLGYGIHIKGSMGDSHILDSLGSFKKFMLDNDLRTKLYYLEHNPLAVAYDYEVSLTPASKDQATEIDMEFSVDHWGFDTHSDKSHKPPFPVVKDGHEDYIDSRDDRKARTCVAKVDVVSKGTKERKLHVGLGYTHTFDDRYHQLNFNYDRSPFGPEETDHFKVCYSASVLFPHVDMQKMYALDTVDMHPKIEVAADLHYGKNCENDKKITARGEMVRTEEHQGHQADRENPEAAPNLDAKLYHRCKKSIENGHRYSRSCRKYWYRSLKLRDYKIDVELENMNAHDKENLEHLESCVEHYLHYYMTKHHHEGEHNPNKIHIDANFSATTDHVDIRITKSDETLEFDHVPHPNDIQARSATPFFEFTNKMMKWNYYKFPFCAVEGNKVHTFDDVHYDIPPMDCYMVIAKDCSQRKLFTILDKKVTNNRFHKAIKVFLGNWLIEALPVSADSDLLVRINGEHIPVTEEKPHYHHQKHNDKDHLMFTVSYDGLFYKIKSRKYGVTVYYDGNAVVVNLSPYYRGKQCGLCGDFNNNDHLEFQGANNCYYKNATDFSYSYAIPGDGCHVPDIVAPCEHHDSGNIINSKSVL